MFEIWNVDFFLIYVSVCRFEYTKNIVFAFYFRFSANLRIFTPGDPNQTLHADGIEMQQGRGGSGNLCRCLWRRPATFRPISSIIQQSYTALHRVPGRRFRRHARQFPYLHFLRSKPCQTGSTPVPRFAARYTYMRVSPKILARASGEREYIFSRARRRWRARREGESAMTREIYSRELRGTVQFSWIVGCSIRFCPTSPGLP